MPLIPCYLRVSCEIAFFDPQEFDRRIVQVDLVKRTVNDPHRAIAGDLVEHFTGERSMPKLVISPDKIHLTGTGIGPDRFGDPGNITIMILNTFTGSRWQLPVVRRNNFILKHNSCKGRM